MVGWPTRARAAAWRTRGSESPSQASASARPAPGAAGPMAPGLGGRLADLGLAVAPRRDRQRRPDARADGPISINTRAASPPRCGVAPLDRCD